MGPMEWSSVLGNFGEFVGAIAVVMTLAYLAVQIRQNSHSLQDSTGLAVNQALSELNKTIRGDAEFAALWLRGVEDIDALDLVERERFRAFVMDLANLAVFSHNLEQTHGHKPLHYDMVAIAGGYYQRYPGIRAIIDSAEDITPPDLMVRLRGAQSVEAPVTRLPAVAD